MSIHGHFTTQYYGNRIQFPTESFLISGTSFFIEPANVQHFTSETQLNMKPVSDNKYDPTAIAIMHGDIQIGWVPADPPDVKLMCYSHINEPLRLVNIKRIDGKVGIRVIPDQFYEQDENLTTQVMFADS